MTQVGVACFFDGVIVDVDHVVQHAHGGVYGALEFVVVKFFAGGAVFEMAHQIDRTEVANGSLGVAGVERDFSTQVG